MSYTSFAVYNQRRVFVAPPVGGECDPYTKPAPLSVVTDLTATPIFQSPTGVVTNLCEDVS